MIRFLLISAALALTASEGASAQILPAWANVVPIEVPEWKTSDETGNCQSVPGTNQVSCRYFSGAMPEDIALLDGAANRPGLQMKRTGAHFYGFPRGTPGTIEMRRFMFCSVSLDCTQPAQTIYSHFIQPEQVFNDSGVLIDNPNFVTFRSQAYARYIVDQGYNGFNIVLPIRTQIGGKTFQFCPSGTQAIRKWYNGAFQRSQTTAGYKNDGNWRFTNSFSWRDVALPRGYETSYDDEMFCGPAQAKALWVNNDTPTGGRYVSRFELATAARTDFVTAQPSRSSSFDQSRNLFWAPAENTRVTLQIGATSGTVNNLDSNYVSDRIASLSDERSGNVLQLDTNAWGNGAWVLNRATPFDSTPNIIIARSQNTAEAAIAGRIENDVFFRVLAVNYASVINHTTRVEAWDLRTGLRLASFPLNASLVSSLGTAPNSLRPEISYSPARNMLYVVSVEFGRFYAINMATGGTTERVVSTANYGVRDIEVDSARDVAYLAMRAIAFGGVDSDSLQGRLYEFSLATNTITRQATVGVGPWQLAIAPVNGYMNLFVTNAADRSNNLDFNSVSQVEVRNFTQVRRLPALNQPTAISVQWLD
jgi:hypothetical protein